MVADALAVAHDHGIVHRDIKLARHPVDDDGAVHLVDFGIVALMDAPTDELTAASTMVGTLRYVAPERLAGGEILPRSDVWALGAVLYEMLTGDAGRDGDGSGRGIAASQAAPSTLDAYRRTWSRSSLRRWPPIRPIATRTPSRCATHLPQTARRSIRTR